MLTAATAALAALGCAHPAYGPDSDDRLTAAVNDSTPGGETILSCDDLAESLGRARNGERPEADRLRSYMQLYHDLTARLANNERAFDRNPTLVYGGGKEQAEADRARAENDRCQQMSADARSEFEVLVRDLFQPLIIQDLSTRRRVARVSFILLRSAVQELALPDADSLLDRISAAEHVVGRR
ncbi:MAG TPA: hypothetical protein VMB50_18540 [Myxococcales bacterium]|nr:hypothetical protein [Myxococcales bacterium]